MTLIELIQTKENQFRSVQSVSSVVRLFDRTNATLVYEPQAGNGSGTLDSGRNGFLCGYNQPKKDCVPESE